MSDEAAKKGLGLSMVVGALLGGVWGVSLGYSLIDVRTWNVAGLGVITAVSIFAVVVAVRGYAEVRRAERAAPELSEPPRM